MPRPTFGRSFPSGMLGGRDERRDGTTNGATRDGAGAAVTGTLGLFSLVDLFQLLAGAKRSGRLRVEHPAGPARIYFDKGDVVHAEFVGLDGEEAVFALFADERGSFEFSIGLPAPRTSIERTTQNVVLDAVRRLDEARRDDVTLPEPDVVPEREADVLGGLTLGGDEQALLDHVDGHRSLARIADRLGLDVEEASRIAARIAAAGGLRLQRRRPRTARLVVRASSERLPTGTAAMDPSILDAWKKATGVSPREILCRRENGRVERLRVVTRPSTGPYLLFDRDLLLRTGLVADEPLLVRPYEEDA